MDASVVEVVEVVVSPRPMLYTAKCKSHHKYMSIALFVALQEKEKHFFFPSRGKDIPSKRKKK